MRVRLRPMLALLLAATSVSVSLQAVGPASSGSRQPAWQIAESEHFRIHYAPDLVDELDHVVRLGEDAYEQISARLSYVLPTKVLTVLFRPSSSITVQEAAAYAMSAAVAPPEPHRNRLVLPIPGSDAELEVVLRHELTHVLVSEIVNPLAGGTGGVPLWVHEGIASYMAASRTRDQERLVRELVASGDLPALSQLRGDGGFANGRVNGALGHLAFEYIEGRWGLGAMRRFLDGLAVGSNVNAYESAFDQTPIAFDAAFRQYAESRFQSVSR